mmetsp:Transcript_17588/g.32615  ORF Transcript_17588/g.32615 Transcript_17588/m.32615 type:complete len:86 (+) Transcript_17588:254-511(+)
MNLSDALEKIKGFYLWLNACSSICSPKLTSSDKKLFVVAQRTPRMLQDPPQLCHIRWIAWSRRLLNSRDIPCKCIHLWSLSHARR